MPKSPRGGSRQAELFPRSKRPTVPIDENHRLVQLADRLDWTEMEVRAEEIRASKLKNAAGRPPKRRAMVLRATRYEPYRVLEDLIRHYAPARYLCGLTETEWTPDHSAVQEHIALFGKPPKAYAYDRGGWSEKNVAELKKRGVEEVGLAPRGKAEWKVSAATKKRLVSERAQVKGGIGTIKHRKYGFDRPAAHSAKMMGFCGQSAVLGFNLNKLVRELAKREERQLVG